MTFVEWLRVRNALKWVAISVGAVLLIAVVFRIAGAHGSTNYIPPGAFAACGAAVALIVATILGASLARETDGHLEIAATKPVSRASLAFEMILVDIAGIFAGFLLGTLAMIVLVLLYPGTISPTNHDVSDVATALLVPPAWYALLMAATASLKRGYGIILGCAWPVSLAILGFANSHNPWEVAVVIRNICTPLAYLLPFNYLKHSPAFDLSMLVVLTLVYLSLAVVQWRRVEA